MPKTAINRNNYASTLVELGTVSSFDPSRLSRHTIYSIVSHINLLKRNGVEISRERLARNPNALLDSLKTRNGTKLKNSYKFQIGMTMKRLFPDVEIDLRRYNEDRSNELTRASSPEFMSSIKRIMEFASQYVKRAYDEILDMGAYDTSLVVLFSVSTSLRVLEILQLRVADLDLILRAQPVNIKTKGDTSGTRIIMANDLLIALINAVYAQRGKVETCMQNKTTDSHARQMLQRLNKGFVVLCSETYMRRRLKEMAASVMIERQSNIILGFNVFRKLTATVLVNGGAHDIAQALNNHSDLSTTLKHYNVQNTQTVENAFADLERMRREMLPAPLITANDARLRIVNDIATTINADDKEADEENDGDNYYDDDDDEDDDEERMIMDTDIAPDNSYQPLTPPASIARKI